MTYFTEQPFRDVSNQIPLYESLRYTNSVRETPLTATFDVFLSYNINDLAVVKGIFYFLSRKGLKVS